MKLKNTFRFPSLVLASLLLCSSWTAAQVTTITSEPELIAILQSDGAAADKAMACKRLAIYGSEKCVTDVGKLLRDEQLSSWARITLEAIPGKESSQVLREAASSVKGRLLIGVLNSIGVRRDVDSVDVLAMHVTDSDAGVASAAAVALGRIGTETSTEVLKKSMAKVGDEVRSAVAEGLVLSAEASMMQGKLDYAKDIYDSVRSAKVPQQRIVEATRGAILSRKTAGIPLLLEELRAPEYFRFQLGLSVARELEGREVDQALASELSKAPADRAALILVAMADRPATVDVQAIIKAVAAEAKP
ncbi:MAG: HEAT repeat domain-containing protein, partial [Pirellula sp.]